MRALISVSDKTGVVDFAKGLRALGWEVIATGGTMKLLSDSGVEVINISDVTGFPEICDGRVKTLHPNVHGGLLARRDDPEHLKALKDNNIEFIDMVCVNLYPFRQTIAKPDVKMEDAIENIDIGGPSMLRSAAKNWADVTVVCDPADYEQVLGEIRAGGNTEKATRLKLSAKAYTHTAEYDAMIAAYMRAQAGLNEKLFLEFDLVQSLRYGENPHQSAKFYREEKEVPYSLAFARQLNGKELSYNNIQDANAVLCAKLVEFFEHSQRGQRFAVQFHSVALFEGEGDVFCFVWCILWTVADEIEIIEWFIGRIFQIRAFVGKMEHVAVHGIWALLGDRHWNVVGVGEIDSVFAALDVPDAPWRDDLRFWAEGLDGELEAHLIVALAGSAVGDVVCPFLLGHFNQRLGDQRTGAAGAEQVAAFVDGATADHWINVIAHEFFLQISDVDLACAAGEGFVMNDIELVALTNIAANSDDFAVVVVFFQPRDDDGGVETTGISQYNFRHERFLLI